MLLHIIQEIELMVRLYIIIIFNYYNKMVKQQNNNIGAPHFYSVMKQQRNNNYNLIKVLCEFIDNIIKKCINNLNIEAIFINKDITPYSIRRDNELLKICKQ